MTTTTIRTESVIGTRDVVNIFKRWDTSIMSKAPAISNDALELAFTMLPSVYGLKPRQVDSLNSMEGGYLLSVGHFTLTESILTAFCYKMKQTREGKARIDKYLEEVKNGDVGMNGVYPATGLKIKEWEAWWNYLDVVVLKDFIKFFGIWDSKESMSKVEWIDTRGMDGDPDERPNKKFIKSDDRKNLHIKGAEWAYNPLMNDYIEPPEKGKISLYSDYIPKQCDSKNFGLVPWLGGKLSVYYVEHSTDGFIYPLILCENYYGQLFAVSGDPKYRVHMPIGTIVEIQSYTSVNWMKDLIDCKIGSFRNKEINQDDPRGKSADSFKIYVGKSGKLKIKPHVC